MLGLRLKFLIFLKEFEPHSSLIGFLFFKLSFYQKFFVFTQLLQLASFLVKIFLYLVFISVIDLKKQVL